MEERAFDLLTRACAGGTRRRLLGLLAGFPVAGLLHSGEVGARPGQRHQAHQRHHHARTHGRQEKREGAHGEACIPTGQRCPSRKPRGKKGKKLGCNACCQGSFITEASGKKVCGCQPNGGRCTPDTASACCSGFCDGSTCQASRCSGSVPCPPCQSCNAATGLCDVVADGTA